MGSSPVRGSSRKKTTVKDAKAKIPGKTTTTTTKKVTIKKVTTKTVKETPTKKPVAKEDAKKETKTKVAKKEPVKKKETKVKETKESKKKEAKPEPEVIETAEPTQRGRKRGRPATAEAKPSKEEQQAAKKAKRDEIVVSHPSHLMGGEGGHVLTLGEGDTGQLGLGPDVMERTKPGHVAVPEGVAQVSAGGMHSVCVTTTGQVYTWGCNDDGALGRATPDEDDCMSPGPVTLPERAVQVSAGDSHSAALTAHGRLYIWGSFRDANGAIGLTPDGKKSETPLEICSELVVCRIASGADHVAFITNDQELYTFGNAEQGQLGRVAECFSNRGGRKGLGLLLTPQRVHVKKRAARFTNVWTGSYVTYAQTTDGDIFSTGLNNYFQLGFDDMINRYTFERAKSFSNKLNWKELSGGQHHAIALDGEGKVYTLGRKEYGRLGLTATEEEAKEKAEPTLVPALADKKCVSVVCGSCVSLAVTEDGETYAWGMGTSHQLGQTEDDDIWEPTLMAGKQLQDRKGLQVSAGGQHTVVLAKDK